MPRKTLDERIAEEVQPLLDENERLLAQWAEETIGREAAEAKIAAALKLHEPKRDDPWSLVDWDYCSCGAYEVHIAADGERAVGPAKYPCATARILLGQ